MREGGEQQHGWKKQVNAMPYRPVKNKGSVFHGSSDVAMTVG